MKEIIVQGQYKSVTRTVKLGMLVCVGDFWRVLDTSTGQGRWGT